MLKRLARVVWWLGALSLLVAAVSLINAARLEYRAHTVSRLNAELSEIQAKEFSLVSRYVPLHGTTLANWDAEFGLYSAALKHVHAPAEAQKESAALAARAKAIYKKLDGLKRMATDAGVFAFIALIAGIVGLLIWAFAYVLGGAFWRPPSAG